MGVKVKEKNSSRYHLFLMNQEFAGRVSPGARVLDAGAGRCPYQELFGHADYESADTSESGNTTFVCNLSSIPVEDERYDFILFNHTMEHVPDPDVVLSELQRPRR